VGRPRRPRLAPVRTSRPARGAGLLFFCALLTATLGGCTTVGGLVGGAALEAHVRSVVDERADAAVLENPTVDDLEWVVVVFELESEFGSPWLLTNMWPTEEAAIVALEEAGLGTIDGNEIGDSTYALYFYGDDSEAMWREIEPIMRDAPVPVAYVELWPDTFESEPRVIE
jgi:hypothetical protein